MKKNNTLRGNFLYYTIYQFLNIIVPFITTPYLARVIGVDGLGVYSYSYSIVYCFMLVTLLGINNYGNRLVAKVRDDNEKLSKTFFELYLFQFIIGSIVLLIYFLFVFIFNVDFKMIAIIQSIFIISSILDITWFYFGLEQIKTIVFRNLIVKVLSLILIFTIVKKPDDVLKYTLIMSSTTFFSQLLLWIKLKSHIKFIKISKKDIVKHIKPNLTLFIPVIVVSIYTIMDKIILGLISGVKEVGFFENAQKIINIPMLVIVGLGTVMLPKISNIISKVKKEKTEQYIEKSIKFVMFLSFAMCFGLISIGSDFSLLYFGNGFEKTGILIILLSITMPFISFANVLRTQYLIPHEKDKIYVISVCLGAIINLIFNFIFISKYDSIGACIGAVAAEITVMLYQMICLRKILPIKKYLLSIIPFLISSIIMFISIYLINYIDINSILKIIIKIILGGFIYCVLNIRYINSLLNLKRGR